LSIYVIQICNAQPNMMCGITGMSAFTRVHSKQCMSVFKESNIW